MTEDPNYRSRPGVVVESTFGALLEAAPDAMVIVDHAGSMKIVNAQTERLFGHPRDALIGQSVEMLVPERFRGRHPGARSGYFGDPRRREMGSGLELFALRRDGSEFPVEISLSPLHTPDGLLVISAIRDITERLEARRKDLLLREVHHRVKNNLQVVSSLLKLHADRAGTPEARGAFADAQLRVQAIATLHENLQEHRGQGRLDFDTWSRALVAAIARVGRRDIRVEVDVHGVELSVDQALPCGLVLHELVTNAFEHAFGDDAAPKRLRVEGAVADGEVRLAVADNGRGMPQGDRATGSLGMHLVRTLARQLRGALELTVDGGTSVVLRFPHEGRSP